MIDQYWNGRQPNSACNLFIRTQDFFEAEADLSLCPFEECNQLLAVPGKHDAGRGTIKEGRV